MIEEMQGGGEFVTRVEGGSCVSLGDQGFICFEGFGETVMGWASC